jgi:hypothetical protein
MGFTHRYHHSPCLSANQLADYLTANAVIRKSILRDAKYPSTAITILYDDSRRAVVNRLAGSESALDYGILSLQRRLSTADLTEYWQKNFGLCIDALESFRGGLSRLDSGKTAFMKPELHNTKLRISGVNISVSVDLMTEETKRNGSRSTGAAILVFCSDKKKIKDTERRCKTIASLIYQMLKGQAHTWSNCDPVLCMAIDVFNAKMFRAMTPQARLYKTVEISCEEVTALWPSIKPPVDYNGPPIPRAA